MATEHSINNRIIRDFLAADLLKTSCIRRLHGCSPRIALHFEACTAAVAKLHCILRSARLQTPNCIAFWGLHGCRRQIALHFEACTAAAAKLHCILRPARLRSPNCIAFWSLHGCRRQIALHFEAYTAADAKLYCILRHLQRWWSWIASYVYDLHRCDDHNWRKVSEKLAGNHRLDFLLPPFLSSRKEKEMMIPEIHPWIYPARRIHDEKSLIYVEIALHLADPRGDVYLISSCIYDSRECVYLII